MTSSSGFRVFEALPAGPHDRLAVLCERHQRSRLMALAAFRAYLGRECGALDFEVLPGGGVGLLFGAAPSGADLKELAGRANGVLARFRSRSKQRRLEDAYRAVLERAAPMELAQAIGLWPSRVETAADQRISVTGVARPAQRWFVLLPLTLFETVTSGSSPWVPPRTLRPVPPWEYWAACHADDAAVRKAMVQDVA